MDPDEDNPRSPTGGPNPAAESSANPTSKADDYAAHSKSKGKFRFKSSKSKSSSRSSRHDSHGHTRSHRHRSDDRDHHHDRNHRRHKRRRAPTPRSSSPSTVPSYPGAPLSPNTAFRESLFDALGDDEGAAFWESVYGQSIHSFGAPRGHTGGGDGRGELEQMDEEEYAAYVRGEMWKRSREGMLEEQERLRAEKKARVRAEKAAGEQEERRRFERAMEDSLRRGRERKMMKEVWKGVWESYIRSWEKIEEVRKKSAGGGEDGGTGNTVRNLLFWPVESGKRRDVNRETVEEFMRRAPPPPQSSGPNARNDATADDLLLSTLKAERVRWHPDKIQHRYGALGLDESVMRSVTEVFQIIDHMWNGLKK
ncbi:hypothetical protein BDW74DRAFT_48501 [Aspergillus multicolor]|uniref:uncharacterized protein n=1 Tax=Aspergillus multicolor TaxID=41759 RepID=UPI003CCCD54C